MNQEKDKYSSLNTEALRIALKEVYGDTVKLAGSFRNPQKAVRFECENGHFWLDTAAKVLSGSNCRKCGKRSLAYKAKLRDKRGDDIVLIGDYVNSDTVALHECGMCGHQWEMAPKHAYDVRKVCPECRHGNKHRATTN